MALCEQELLLEEWKQNVALYIDQDKRGLERIKMYLAVHGGLLAFYSFILTRLSDWWSVPAAVVVGVVGLFLTAVTRKMSNRAHQFILLRVAQAMLIENTLKALRAHDAAWQTSSGVITTFTREHVAFKGEPQQDNVWAPLIDEVKTLGKEASDPVLGVNQWKGSMRHRDWLERLHWVLILFWASLVVLILIAALSSLDTNAESKRAVIAATTYASTVDPAFANVPRIEQVVWDASMERWNVTITAGSNSVRVTVASDGTVRAYQRQP